MPSQSRKHRGYATQRLVADWFRGRLWPFCEPVGAGRGGADLTGTPGAACEVKATVGDNSGALKQAVRQAKPGELPFVVWRPNGYGPAVIDQWPVLLTLGHFTELVRDAGYGGDIEGMVDRLTGS